MAILMGVFLILHGLVHLLYAGQALRLFELRAGMLWPDSSWLFSRLLGNEATRWLAGILLALAALGLVCGGLGLFLRQDWWRVAAVGAVALSIATFFVLWNGQLRALDEQGMVGVLISLVFLGVVLFLKWPVRL